MLKRDFNFLQRVFKYFFSSDEILKYLNFFYECKVHDFEKWIQIELAWFLENNDEEDIDITEWKREIAVELHRGMARNVSANKMQVDFLIKPYRSKGNNSFIFLELKQNRSLKTCISRMFDDLDKMDKGKGKEARNARGLWVAGIFETEEDENIEDMAGKIILDEAKDRGWDINKNLIEIKTISNHFAYTFF